MPTIQLSYVGRINVAARRLKEATESEMRTVLRWRRYAGPAPKVKNSNIEKKTVKKKKKNLKNNEMFTL